MLVLNIRILHKNQRIKILTLIPEGDKIKIMEKQKNAVGRRKEAVTSVFLSKGDGNITLTEKIIKLFPAGLPAKPGRSAL